MNKRINLTIVSLFLVLLTIGAATVSREQAQKMAAQFALKHKGFSPYKSPGNAEARLKAIQSEMVLAVETPELFGFDLKGDKGFIIVSGDDRTDAILGYATNGSLRSTQFPPALKTWLNNMCHEIQLINGDGTLARRQSEAQTEVEPLLSTQWDQDAPYNLLCPAVEDVDHALTGCVATAMAQVMYYYKYPVEATTAIPKYTTKTHKIIRPELPSIIFDWEAMDNGQDYTAIATLMAYCGQAVNMDYGPLSSGAASSLIPIALTNYFDYDSSVRNISRSSFGIDEWEGMVRQELIASRPVIYSGDDAMDSGHAFIVDGCRADGTFHINWGWGGYCDGYYLLSLLDHHPSYDDMATEDGYSINQDMIIGIQPNTGIPFEEEKKLTVRKLEYTNTTSVIQREDNGSFNVGVHWELINNTNSSFDANIFIGLCKENDLVRILVPYGTTNVSTTGYVYHTYDCTISRTIADGDYRIVMMQTIDGNNVECIGSDTHYIGLHIEGDELMLSLYPQNFLSIRSLSYPAGRVSGQICELVANVQNRGSEYNGTLWLFANGTMVTGNGAYIRANEREEVRFHLKPVSKITITTDKEGNNVIYEGPDVKDEPNVEGSDILLKNLEMASGTNLLKRGETLQANMAILDIGDKPNTSYSLAYTIDNGQPVTITDVPSLKSGSAVCNISIDLPEETLSGEHQLDISVTCIDGDSITIEENDGHRASMTFTLYNDNLGRQKVLLGHYTATWCYACPYGDAALDALSKLRDDYSMVSFQVQDQLSYGPAAVYNQFAVGYPSAFYDFMYDADENNIFCESIGYYNANYAASLISSRIDAAKAEMSFANIQLKANILNDDSVRIVVTGKCTSDFDILVGDVNLTLMLTEDSVVYDQWDGDKYINGYLHHGVLRTMLTPAWGTPVNWNDDSFEMTFTFKPDKDWDVEHMKAVALLGKPFNGENYEQLHLQNCNDLSLRQLEKLEMKGDMNGDGIIDVADIICIIKAIGSNESKADMNGDAIVTSADITAIIKAIGTNESKADVRRK